MRSSIKKMRRLVRKSSQSADTDFFTVLNLEDCVRLSPRGRRSWPDASPKHHAALFGVDREVEL
jgi:hypothetical protein